MHNNLFYKKLIAPTEHEVQCKFAKLNVTYVSLIVYKQIMMGPKPLKSLNAEGFPTPKIADEVSHPVNA